MTPIEKKIHGLRVINGRKKMAIQRLKNKPWAKIYLPYLMREIAYTEQKIQTFIKIKSTYEKNSSKN
jgi:hypothetical protein